MNAEELRRKGDAAFRAKKFDEAIALYTEASPALRQKRAGISGWSVQREQGFGCRHMLLMQRLGLGAKGWGSGPEW